MTRITRIAKTKAGKWSVRSWPARPFFSYPCYPCYPWFSSSFSSFRVDTRTDGGAMFIRGWRWVSVVLLAGVVGCGRTPPGPAGTGAKETAQGYHEALLRRDWSGAYRFL